METKDYQVLCMKHDRFFKILRYVILFATIFLGVSVFIWGIVMLVIGGAAGLLYWIFGGLAVLVFYVFAMFLLSVSYDIKIIRNQALGLSLSVTNNEIEHENNVIEHRGMDNTQPINKWWDDKTEMDIEFFDERSTPKTLTVNLADNEALNNINFSYPFDGEEHYPQAKIIVKGKEKGYAHINGKFHYDKKSGKYNKKDSVADSERYFLIYELYKTNDINEDNYIDSICVYIEILKNT